MDLGSGMLSGKKHYLADSITCASSRVNAKRYSDFMASHGSISTQDIGEADIVLVDTCAALSEREDNSIELIKRSELNAKRDAKIIVSGCLAAINPEKLVRHYKGEFFSPKNENHLATILGIDDQENRFLTPLHARGGFMDSKITYVNRTIQAAVTLLSVAHRVNRKVRIDRLPFFDRLLTVSSTLDARAYALTISTGCLGNCSFCVIPLSKGKTRSLPMGLVYEKVKSLSDDGISKIFLTSEDTGAYGQDIGANVVQLLQKIDSLPGNFRLYINFFDPRWLHRYKSEVVSTLAVGRVKYLELPLQSASNSVLRRMRRAYQVEQVLPAMREIKRLNPKAHLSTQFIVGFPGETEDEFQETLQFVRQNKRLFSRIDFFKFDPRKGAATEKMDDHLPRELILKRYRLLKKEAGLFRSIF